VTRPAARQGDQVTATDTHVVMVPSPPGGPVPTPLPHPFAGQLVERLEPTVLIGGRPAATVGSVARNVPPHLPTPPGTAFQRPPSNRGTVRTGSTSVLLGGSGAARQGDPVVTCNDPSDLPAGTVTTGDPTVVIGG
jgi:uncharacterized Zn-binding protein involved in type VI secretion